MNINRGSGKRHQCLKNSASTTTRGSTESNCSSSPSLLYSENSRMPTQDEFCWQKLKHLVASLFIARTSVTYKAPILLFSSFFTLPFFLFWSVGQRLARFISLHVTHDVASLALFVLSLWLLLSTMFVFFFCRHYSLTYAFCLTRKYINNNSVSVYIDGGRIKLESARAAFKSRQMAIGFEKNTSLAIT